MSNPDIAAGSAKLGAEGRFSTPYPVNEPVRSYAPGSPERLSLQKRLEEMRAEVVDIPVIIGGDEIRTGRTVEVTMPHDHGHVLARCHQAGPEEARRAIEASRAAWEEWSNWSWEDRAAVFLRAAELLAGPWRDTLNAATMLGQSKTVHQAEIDSACELIDFWRFNAHYATEVYDIQPESSPGTWNRLDYRPLEGFIYAVTPFNFTSIIANLPTAPALMGNVAIWKPARSSELSSYYIMRLLEAAGLPPGVVNFLPGHGPELSDVLLASPEFAGLHFTGSTATFQLLWKQIGDNLERYRSYPRIVGETGGKDFIVAHESAEVQELAVAIVRGGFEYQGQKCSAVSRVYLPGSIWDDVRERVLGMLEEIKVGDTSDFSNFMGAVIDEKAFRKIASYIDYARESEDAEIIAGGGYDESKGWFVEPTVVVTKNPQHRLMKEEIFGPVVTIYVYDEEWHDALRLVNETSPYGLTGAVFARDRAAIRDATAALRHAAGNFYINDKPTGAVVGQQPFGGGRASGTNDKAGSVLNLIRWVSPRAIKETLVPPADYRYEFLG